DGLVFVGLHIRRAAGLHRCVHGARDQGRAGPADTEAGSNVGSGDGHMTPNEGGAMPVVSGCTGGSLQPSRRQMMRWTFATLVGAAGARVSRTTATTKAVTRDPEEILRGLMAGNERFASGQAAGPRRGPQDFVPLAEGQAPLAVIIGCA